MAQNNETERIVSLRVRARNNYTCRDEQDITTWDDTDYDDVTQVAVAIGLDEAERESIERRGYSGLGAGAVLLARIVDEGDDPEDEDAGTEEEIDSLDHPLVRRLPVGSIRQLRGYIAQERDEEYWNGHNMVTIPATRCEELLRKIRYGR